MSGMKMYTLLFGVILGLLAVVHSTPVNTEPQIPTLGEDEVIQEALMDGFLVNHNLLTTESPKRNTTIQASQQPSDSKESDMIIGSAAEEETSVFLQHGHYATTSQSVSHAQSSTSAVLPVDTDDSILDSSTTQSLQSALTSSSVSNEAQSSVIPDHISVSQTADLPGSDQESGSGDMFFQYTTVLARSDSGSGSGDSSFHYTTDLPKSNSGSGSGDLSFQYTTDLPRSNSASGSEETPDQYLTTSSSVTSSSNTETSTASSTSMASLKSSGFIKSEKRLRLLEQPNVVNTGSPHNTGESTPGWIIIVGFIVGLAALVMLFAAIATRDKWNGPKQVTQQETKTNSTNQQMELEMETFLHKDKPRENGKAVEYTVIPLDELPENSSSH